MALDRQIDDPCRITDRGAGEQPAAERVEAQRRDRAGERDAVDLRAFVAIDDGEPVAWSYLVYIPESPIVLLGGAATLPEARGQGAYTALVKRRLDDARADGREAAVIQADRNTSAPICAKLGFRELCSLEVYVWSPPA